MSTSRIIGIRHRRKQTAEGDAKPTCVAIVDGGKTTLHDLGDDTAELDFLLKRFPIEWRRVDPDENLDWFDGETCPGGYRRHQCKWRKVKEDEDASTLNESHLSCNKKEEPVCCTHVPVAFEGLQKGDKVAMILGGSGDRFAGALSRRGKEIDAQAYRIPPYRFFGRRGERSKDDDQLLLAELFSQEPHLFYLVRPRDVRTISVKVALIIRQDALKSRIACGQRIIQRHCGQIFLSPEGFYPEGVIEDQYDEAKANDVVYQALKAEQKLRDKELAEAVKAAPVWKIFEPIEGCGPRVAAGLIAPIADIRRFWVEPDQAEMDRLKQELADHKRLGGFDSDKVHVVDRITPDMNDYQQLQLVAAWQRQNGKTEQADWLERAIAGHRQRAKLRRKARNRGKARLKAFCGVHVIDFDEHGQPLSESQFPRRRRGKTSNWNPIARQTLYLLGDQFNRRPKSDWGMKLLENKRRQRELYPDIIEKKVSVTKGGKTTEKTVKMYTDGHILKRALWRTRTRFVEFLFNEWTRLEVEANGR